LRWRVVVLNTQIPLIRTWPGPHVRTCVIMPSGWWSGVGDIACADVATAKAKITVMNLIILSSVLKNRLQSHFSGWCVNPQLKRAPPQAIGQNWITVLVILKLAVIALEPITAFLYSISPA
jgi:hypothetical protein